MFEIINLSLGIIKVGSIHTVKFPYKDIKEITGMKAPCDCTNLTNDKVNQLISVRYKAKEIPEHLKLEGARQYKTTKGITVNWINLEGEKRVTVLSFNATVRG